MKVTEDVRTYAAEQEISEGEALRSDMDEKSRGLLAADAKPYSSSVQSSRSRR